MRRSRSEGDLLRSYAMNELILKDIFIEEDPTEDQLEEQIAIECECETKAGRDRTETIEVKVTEAVAHWLKRTAENAGTDPSDLIVRLITASMELTLTDLARKGWHMPSVRNEAEDPENSLLKDLNTHDR
jgi:hypothetical protein